MNYIYNAPRIYTSFLLIAICFLLSCNRSPDKPIAQSGLIIPVLDRNRSVIDATGTIASNVEIIVLKEKDDSTFLSGIDKMAIVDSNYYVFDKKFSKVNRYDRNGRFINSYGELGTLPNEFRKISDFEINQDQLQILSHEDKAIYKYHLDGKFLNKLPTRAFGYEFINLPQRAFLINSAYVVNSENPDKDVIILDSNSKISKGFFTFNPEISNRTVAYAGFLKRGNDGAYFNRPYDENIYKYNTKNHEFEHFCRVNLLNTYRQNRIDSVNKIASNIRSNKLYSNFIGNTFLKNSDLLVFSFEQDILKYCIYNLKSKKIHIIDRSIDNPFLKLLGNPVFLSDTNELYFSVPRSQIENVKTLLKGTNYPSEQKLWQRKISTLNKDDKPNFYLIKIQLKAV